MEDVLIALSESILRLPVAVLIPCRNDADALNIFVDIRKLLGHSDGIN